MAIAECDAGGARYIAVGTLWAAAYKALTDSVRVPYTVAGHCY